MHGGASGCIYYIQRFQRHGAFKNVNFLGDPVYYSPSGIIY